MKTLAILLPLTLATACAGTITDLWGRTHAGAHAVSHPYIYGTSFTTNSTNFIISGAWSSGNGGRDIRVNSTSQLPAEITGTGWFSNGIFPTGWNSMTAFALTSAFVPSRNMIDFVGEKANSTTGKEMKAVTPTMSTPEPGTSVLTGLSFLLVGGAVLQRRRA